MKYSIFSYRISLFIILLTVFASSCKKETSSPNTFTLTDNTKDKVWLANPSGDTIVLKFSSPVMVEKININNVMEWVTYDLNPNQLTLFVRPNSGIGRRSGSLGILSLEKGEVESMEVVKVSQESGSNLAKEKILYTYYPLSGLRLDKAKAQNKVLKLILPADGHEMNFSDILKSNLSKDDVIIDLEYPDGEPAGWVESIDLIMADDVLNGIKIKTIPIPSDVEQRKVKVTIQDKEFMELKAELACIQVKDPIQVANPGDAIKDIPLRPAPYSVLLSTNIPKDKIHLTIKFIKMDGYYDDVEHQKRIERIATDPIYINNYLLDLPVSYLLEETVEALDEWQRVHPFTLLSTPNGIMVEGQTITTNKFFGKRWFTAGYDLIRKVIVITNDVNDYITTLVLNDKNPRSGYILFEDETKEKTIQLPVNGGQMGLTVLTNGSGITLDLPQWIKRAFNQYRFGVDIAFPDRVSLKEEGLIYQPNPFRAQRTATVPIDYYLEDSSVDDRMILSDYSEYLMKPLVLTFVQEAFTGDYVFEIDPATPIEDQTTFSSWSGSKTYNLKTNLVESQIRVSKTAKSAWIDYEMKLQSDPDTGFVTGVIFSYDRNKSGEDREVTYTFEGPEGEGLSPIIFKFKQSK